MRKTAEKVIKDTRKELRARKVLTLGEVAGLLGASLPTGRRMLKQWDTYRSYNHNGRYYALPQVVRFDAHGLWYCRRIGFSEFGNLMQTVLELVRSSAAGLAAAELGQLLGMRPHGFLSLFRGHPRLRREKHQGRFVYFSGDEATYRGQKELLDRGYERSQLPKDAEAIAVLVAAIKHPQFDLEGLCGQLKAEGVASTPQRIENLFARHGLAPKKTPVSGS